MRSPQLSANDLVLTDVEARLQASDAGQSLGLVGIYEGTPFQASLGGAFADWRKPLSCGNYNVKTAKCSGQNF